MTEQLSLHEMAANYFKHKFEYHEPETPIRGRSGQKWKFDALIKYNNQTFGVFIREWNRSIGVNQVRQLEKACRDTKCAGGILVGNGFSGNAEIFGENVGIQVLDRSTLAKKLREMY